MALSDTQAVQDVVEKLRKQLGDVLPDDLGPELRQMITDLHRFQETARGQSDEIVRLKAQNAQSERTVKEQEARILELSKVSQKLKEQLEAERTRYEKETTKLKSQIQMLSHSMAESEGSVEEMQDAGGNRMIVSAVEESAVPNPMSVLALDDMDELKWRYEDIHDRYVVAKEGLTRAIEDREKMRDSQTFFEKQCNEYKSRFDDLEMELKRVKKLYETSESERTALIMGMGDVEKSGKNLRQQVKDYEEELKELRYYLEGKTPVVPDGQMEKLRKDVRDAEKKLQEKDEELEWSNKQISAIKEKLEEAEDVIEKMQDFIRQNSAVPERIRKYEKEIRILEQQEAGHVKELSRMKERMATMQDKIKRQEIELRSLAGRVLVSRQNSAAPSMQATPRMLSPRGTDIDPDGSNFHGKLEPLQDSKNKHEGTEKTSGGAAGKENATKEFKDYSGKPKKKSGEEMVLDELQQYSAAKEGVGTIVDPEVKAKVFKLLGRRKSLVEVVAEGIIKPENLPDHVSEDLKKKEEAAQDVKKQEENANSNVLQKLMVRRSSLADLVSKGILDESGNLAKNPRRVRFQGTSQS